MARSSSTILVADDDKVVREYLDMALRCEGCTVELAEDGQEAVDLIEDRPEDFAAVILDLLMPRRDGFWALQEIHRIDKTLPVFALSAANSPINVVQAMKAGAVDFIEKPVSGEDLSKVIRACRLQNGAAAPAPAGPEPRGTIYLGTGPAMRHVRALLRQIGRSIPPVLILGETGSGKEVLARELHGLSPRADQPFLKLNCAALPSELVESELFGYERGAFTGAFQRKAGMFEIADGGTILLDEIGDMDFKLQAKLLQVLQDREFQRLGGKETVRVDVRIMAATHRDLETAMREGNFREDLFYRLNVVNVSIPPLRERTEDIIGLAECFLEKHRAATGPLLTLGPVLKDAMLKYNWPGNIRELENTVRRYVVFHDAEAIAAELRTRSGRRQPLMLVSTVAAASGTNNAVPAGATGMSPLHAVAKAKDQAESQAILNALQATHWNRKRAAQMLNIDYKALLYRMKKLSLGEQPGSFSEAND